MALLLFPVKNANSGPATLKSRIARPSPPPKFVGTSRGSRIYFYMHAAYPGRGIISKKNRRLFAAWDRQDPVGSMWKLDLNPETFQIGGESTRYFGNGGKYHA